MKLLNFSCNTFGLLMTTTLLAAISASAKPVDGTASSCTFVDAVVTGQHAAVGAPMAAAAALNQCDVVQYSTAVEDIGVRGSVRASTQNILILATIFEEQDASDVELETIFEFGAPLSRKNK
jgi:hypothetical protein